MTSGPTVGVVSSHLIHHHVHDSLGNRIANILTDDRQIGVNKVTNGLNLSLQLGINGVQVLFLQEEEVCCSNSALSPGGSRLLTSLKSLLVA